MEISDLIKEIRIELGLTQKELADKLSVSFSTVNRWENEKTKPNRIALVMLKKLCEEDSVSKELLDLMGKRS